MPRYQELMSKEFINLATTFQVNPKSCDNPKHYENYIRYQAIMELKQGIGVTHIFIDEDEVTQEKRMMGYVTLRCSSLIKDVGESSRFGLPALEISELAVSKDYERQHIGTDMVKYAISVAMDLSINLLGIQYLVLCADPKAENFYSTEALGLNRIRNIEDIPREHTNLKCVPMYLKLKIEESIY